MKSINAIHFLLREEIWWNLNDTLIQFPEICVLIKRIQGIRTLIKIHEILLCLSCQLFFTVYQASNTQQYSAFCEFGQFDLKQFLPRL